MAKSQQNQQTGQLFVTLTCEEPRRLENGEVIITSFAVVVRKNQQAEEGRDVQFFVSGIEEGKPLRTDRNGRVQRDITVPPVAIQRGSCTIDAQVVGSSAVASKSVSLKKFQPKIDKAKELIPSQFRIDNRSIRVTFLLKSELGEPMKGVTVVLSTKDFSLEIISGEDGGIEKIFEMTEYSEKTVKALVKEDPKVFSVTKIYN